MGFLYTAQEQFCCLLAVFWAIHVVTADTGSWKFEVSGGGVIDHMTRNPRTGDVFIGATNHIIKLNKILQHLANVSTGPKLVSQWCHPMASPDQEICCSVPCDKRYNKTETNSVTKALIVHPVLDHLFYCSNLKLGQCYKYNSSSLQSIDTSNPFIVSSFADSPVHMTFDENGTTLYVATTNENLPTGYPFTNELSDLAVRNYTTLDFSEIRIFASSRVSQRTDGRYTLLYQNVFISGTFTYFLFGQLTQSGEYVTYISRICHDDLKFRSYTDIPLSCGLPDKQSYNVLVASHLTRPARRLAASLGLNRVSQSFHDDILVTFFSSVVDGKVNDDTAVCVFRMEDIRKAFTAAVKKCFSGEGFTGEPKYSLFSDKRACIKLKPEDITDDYCNAREFNFPVAGEPIKGNATLKLANTKVTGTQSVWTPDQQHTVVLAAANKATLLKIVLDSSNQTVLYDNVTVAGDSHQSLIPDILLDTDASNLYVATGAEVYKLPIQQCSKYQDCDSCLSSHNPYCGWCTLEKKCGTKQDCSNPDTPLRWLSYAQDECPRIASVVPSQLEISQASNAKVVIQVVNLTLPVNSSIECAFTYNSDTSVTGASVNGSTLRCNLPSSDRLPKIQQGTPSAVMKLSVRLDGIDYVDSTVTIFYCLAHDNCSQCTLGAFPCTWCSATSNKYNGKAQQCFYGTEPCAGDYMIPSVKVKPGPSRCPRLTGQSQGELLVPSSLYKEIVLQTSNIQPFQQSNLKCHFMLNPKRIVIAKYADNSITCASVQFVYSENVPTHSVPFYITWGDDVLDKPNVLDNPVQLQVEVYKCEQLSHYCGACLTADPKYQCGWCKIGQCTTQSTCPNTHPWLDRNQTCNDPWIKSVDPLSGPVAGGTTVRIEGENLGKVFQDIAGGITVAGTKCEPLQDAYQPSKQILCITKPAERTKQGSVRVVVSELYSNSSTQIFSFVEPVVTGFTPLLGPESGGTLLTISGQNLLVGNNQRVVLKSASKSRRRRRMVGDDFCVVQTTMSNNHQIVCETSKGNLNSPSRSIVVEIDDAVINNVGGLLFNYKKDPIVKDVVPRSSMRSGGITIDVTGESFNIILSPKMVVYYDTQEYISPCTIINSTRLQCLSPEITSLKFEANSSLSLVSLSFGFIMDKVESVLNLTNSKLPSVTGQDYYYFKVHQDPTVEIFPDEVKKVQPGTEYLNINGLNLKGGLSESDINVTIGHLLCEVTAVDNRQLTCALPKDVPSGWTATATVYLGRNKQVALGEIQFEASESGPVLTTTWIIVIVMVGVAILVIVVALIVAYLRKSMEKDKMQKRLESQLDTLECKVAKECKEAFAELQTDMTVIQNDLCGMGLPYRSYRSFAMKFLFPNTPEQQHPVTRELQIEPSRKESVEKGLKLFNQLIASRNFLLVFIRVVEQNPNFSARERTIMASLLSVALQNRMEYHTDILKTLLKELIEQYIDNHKKPQLLFRRAESVAERMLSNWFAFLLHKSLLDGAGEPLYMLFRAIKQQVEKGPVDAVTGEAKYSLNEDKLIRQMVEYKQIALKIPQQDFQFGNHESVRVLDCDTISQVKEKILDANYKHGPFSNRPNKDSMDLEWKPGHTSGIVLKDEDMTSKMDGEYKRLNTLAHYGVSDSAVVSLVAKQSFLHNANSLSTSSSNHLLGAFFDGRNSPATGLSRTGTPKTLTLEDSQGTQYYHLVKLSDWDNQREDRAERGNKMVSEVYLTRLLATKMSLQKYSDDLIETIYNAKPGHNTSVPVPFAIKYMFDFLDDQAIHHNLLEPDIIHAWKSNSLPLRFWVSVIKNPDFVFDVYKSNIVDSCLTVVAQAFMDACSMTEHPLGKDSPSSKLLYAKDIPRYKQMVDKYYQFVRQMPAISDQDMNSMLAEESRSHFNDFNLQSALYELYQIALRHNNELLKALDDDQFSRSYRLPQKLQQVHDCMR